MKKYSIFVLSIIFTLLFFPFAMSSTNDFFTKDPDAIYDKSFTNMDVVIEIPGYKLDPQRALAIPLGTEEYEYAKRIDPDILEKAKKYVKFLKMNVASDYLLYAAKDLGKYILLYFNEPKVMDSGFELIYSKKLKRIIGSFSAGYKG